MISQPYGAGDDGTQPLVAPVAANRQHNLSPFRGLFAGGVIVTASSVVLWWLILAALSRLLG